MPAIKVSYLYRRTLPALSAVLLLAMPPPSPASGIVHYSLTGVR